MMIYSTGMVNIIQKGFITLPIDFFDLQPLMGSEEKFSGSAHFDDQVCIGSIRIMLTVLFTEFIPSSFLHVLTACRNNQILIVP